MVINMGEILWKDRKRVLGMPLSFTKYSFTEERFFLETGFFNSKEDEVRLYRILDLQLNRSLWQKIFGVGTIIVNSADKSLGTFAIKNIKNAKQVKEQLSDLVELNRDKKRVVNREMMFDSDVDTEEDDDNQDF